MNFKSHLAIILLFFACSFANSQPINVRLFQFSPSVWDTSTGTINVKVSGPSTYLVSVGLSRINLDEWTRAGLNYNVEVEAFAQKNNSPQIVKISDEIKFTTNDFIGSSSVTVTKLPTLTIPAGFIDQFGGVIIVRYRFFKQNYPFPYNQDGWTEWFTATTFNLRLEGLGSGRAGPDGTPTLPPQPSRPREEESSGRSGPDGGGNVVNPAPVDPNREGSGRAG